MIYCEDFLLGCPQSEVTVIEKYYYFLFAAWLFGMAYISHRRGIMA
jgi:hypothetical protein